MESTVSIDQFQEELASWKHELSSIKHELREFEHQLETFSSKDLAKDLLAEIEHFQNSFICQKEVIDKLRHDLPDSRQKVQHIYNALRPLSSNDDHAAQEKLSDRMDTFRRIYQGLKQDFLAFRTARR